MQNVNLTHKHSGISYLLFRIRSYSLLLSLLACLSSYYTFAQPNSTRISNENRDSTDIKENELVTFPTKVNVSFYHPNSPTRTSILTDSLLDLTYTRFDPIFADRTQLRTLNSLAATSTPFLPFEDQYQVIPRLIQNQGNFHEQDIAPYFIQDIPFSYTAYDQGLELNDGQIRVLFGRKFNKGWNIGFRYHRIYQGASTNVYPDSDAEQIRLGLSISYLPKNSKHHVFVDYQSKNYDQESAGGYSFAKYKPYTYPDATFLAQTTYNPIITNYSKQIVNALYRYYLNKQTNHKPNGWAFSNKFSYTTQNLLGYKSSISSADSFSLSYIDLRGLRSSIQQTSYIGQSKIEYYSPDSTSQTLKTNFSAGISAGYLDFDPEYTPFSKKTFLLNAIGSLKLSLLNNLNLEASTTLAINENIGQGKLNSTLSYALQKRILLQPSILLTRYKAPLNHQLFSVNNQIIYNATINPTTRIKIGGSVKDLKNELELYLFNTNYDNPTLLKNDSSFNQLSSYGYIELGAKIPLKWKFINFNIDASYTQEYEKQELLPQVRSHQSLAFDFLVFKKKMNLKTGIDGYLISPVKNASYLPLQNAVGVEENAIKTDWQFAYSPFIAFKVQSFKAFVRFENLLTNSGKPAQTVQGFPLVRSNFIGTTKAYTRFGISFFLLN